MFSANFKPIIKKIATILFTIASVLTMAQSCSLPGFNTNRNNNQAPTNLGVLKFTNLPNGQAGFVRANAGKDANGQIQQQLLTPNSVIKIHRVDAQNLYVLTFNRGLYKTNNAGQIWNRIYVLPVDFSKIPQSSSLTQQEINLTNNALIANNNLQIRDFVIDKNNPNNIFVAGQENGFGKIFRSIDGGNTFQTSYTELQNNTSIDLLAIFPNNSRNIYAYTGGSTLIQSTDLGQTWTKIKDFTSRPVQFGFIQEDGNTFYTIFKNEGFSVSTDSGVNWRVISKFASTKTDEKTGQNQNTEIKTPSPFSFAVQDPVISTGWAMVANNSLWYTSNLNEPAKQINLPFENDKQNITAVSFDPIRGKERMLVAIGDTLLETQNGGLSWQKKEIQIQGSIGNITNIVFEPEEPETFYLTLANRQIRKIDGVWQ